MADTKQNSKIKPALKSSITKTQPREGDFYSIIIAFIRTTHDTFDANQLTRNVDRSIYQSQ